jgi:ankyrin repeat protein
MLKRIDRSLYKAPSRTQSQSRIVTPSLQYDYKVSILPTNERMSRIDRELIWAARENNLPEVSRLLSVGADVNAKDYHENTPLHWACYKGHVQVFNELLEHGADIEAKNRYGWTSLHYAVSINHLAIVNELLSRGANTETQHNSGKTPLHTAATHYNLVIVKALLSGGANILAADNQGRLPSDRAVRYGRSAVAKYLLQELYATTRRLPLHELVEDITWIGNSGVPRLHDALRRNVLGTDDVVEIIEYLVGRNPAWLSSRDQDGSLPLHVACRRGASFAIVQSLVNRYKAPVKSLTPQGDLPVFLACEMPEMSLDTIFLLMKLYPDLVYR